MKRLFIILIAVIACTAVQAADSLNVFYRIRLDQDIDASAQRLVVRGLEMAAEADADYVLLDLDTYGGAVDAADSIRSAILRYERPVIAFVNMQAASAGALISIACDSIYMKTGSSIGAATVVDQNGAVMPDKYQSFMRGMMRSTASATGRDPYIAEAMVSADDVLSLTPHEAMEVGYCNGICESAEEVAQLVSGNDGYEIRSMDEDMTWVDHVIQFLLNPFLQSIFMMMIIGGIFVEIRTPGVGIPLVVAIIGAVLYFAPAYMGHLAEHWEILLFVVGLVLVALEIFLIPGFGVCGISGIVAIIASLALAMVDNGVFQQLDGTLNLQPLIKPLAIVVTSFTASIASSMWLVARLYPTRSFDKIALRKEMKAEEGYTGVVTGLETLVGTTVTVFSDMRPGGKVQSEDGRIHEATLKFGGFAAKGTRLRVLSAEQGRLYCEVE